MIKDKVTKAQLFWFYEYKFKAVQSLQVNTICYYDISTM